MTALPVSETKNFEPTYLIKVLADLSLHTAVVGKPGEWVSLILVYSCADDYYSTDIGLVHMPVILFKLVAA